MSVSTPPPYPSVAGVEPLPEEAWRRPRQTRWRRAVEVAFETFVQPLVEPVPRERHELNRIHRERLPESLRTPQQVLGITQHSCGATHSVLERCNFACTSCYLTQQANAVPPLPAAEVRRQLDQLREYLGPRGKAQITAGEVTLLPVDVLGSYVAYARHIGLDPMVMSHGERLLAEPKYLESLVADSGLEKISIHVDSTQRGRRGWHREQTEAELNPLRERYSELIRETRRKTGRPLRAAHTVTVNRRNLEQVPDILRWLSHNVDAFRMISFQPVAAVGRTQDERDEEVSLNAVWQQICRGLGRRLNRQTIHFGHPDCNVVVPLLVAPLHRGLLVVEAVREGRAWDQAFFGRFMKAFTGFSGASSRLRAVVLALSLSLRRPLVLLEAPFYGLYRLWGLRDQLPAVLGTLLRLRPVIPRPLALVIHKFMSPDELDTPLGRERLAACVFKLPVGDRMVAMCEMNATDLRQRVNEAQRSAAASQTPKRAAC